MQSCDLVQRRPAHGTIRLAMFRPLPHHRCTRKARQSSRAPWTARTPARQHARRPAQYSTSTVQAQQAGPPRLLLGGRAARPISIIPAPTPLATTRHLKAPAALGCRSPSFVLPHTHFCSYSHPVEPASAEPLPPAPCLLLPVRLCNSHRELAPCRLTTLPTRNTHTPQTCPPLLNRSLL